MGTWGRLSLFVLALTALTATVLLTGCGATTDWDHGAPTPITLANTAPNQLDAIVGLTIGGSDSPPRDTTVIAIQFLAAGRLVSFQKGETLACAGAAPQRLTTSFDVAVPTASVAGKRFMCTYSTPSSSSTATLQFVIPSAPAILSPSEAAQVVRDTHTPIHFQASGNGVAIVASGPQGQAVAHVTSAGVATVDTSHFAVGVGSVRLTVTPAVADATAPAFASLKVYCTAIAQADVTWR